MAINSINVPLSNLPLNWSELTAMFDKNAKIGSVALSTIRFADDNFTYQATYDKKKERVFINQFDEYSSTCSIDSTEVVAGPKNSLLIEEPTRTFLNRLRSSPGKSIPVFNSVIAASVRTSKQTVQTEHVKCVSILEEMSRESGPLSIWLRLNEFFFAKNQSVYQDSLWQAWRTNLEDSGWHVYIQPRNHTSPCIDLSCDPQGNLLIDGMKWETSLGGIYKMGVVLSFSPNPASIAVKEELRINAQFAEQQQRTQKTDRPCYVFYSQEISDLLGGGYFGFPRTEPVLLHEQRYINKRPVGVACTIGRKKKMEDAEVTVSGFIQTQNRKYPIEVFGVYDGHCGFKAATFVKKNIFNYLIHYLISQNPNAVTREGVVKAVKLCYQQLDADFPELIDGTTALTTLILNGYLYLVNTGDSRALIVKDGKIIQATEDQKPEIERYKMKIEELGGEITDLHCRHKRVKVPGQDIRLAVARAIGDKRFIGISGKCVILPDPEVTSFALEDITGGYLIVACDGLFDYNSSDQIGKAVQEMHSHGYSTEKMAQLLVFSSYNHAYSEDNLTAIVVKL